MFVCVRERAFVSVRVSGWVGDGDGAAHDMRIRNSQFSLLSHISNSSLSAKICGVHADRLRLSGRRNPIPPTHARARPVLKSSRRCIHTPAPRKGERSYHQPGLLCSAHQRVSFARRGLAVREYRPVLSCKLHRRTACTSCNTDHHGVRQTVRAPTIRAHKPQRTVACLRRRARVPSKTWRMIGMVTVLNKSWLVDSGPCT